MELLGGFEPPTSSLPRMRATDCAKVAYKNALSYASNNIHQYAVCCQEKNAMISGISPFCGSAVVYCWNMVVYPGAAGGKSMRIGKGELGDLRDELVRLTDFIRIMETDELPYFYRCFDAMKNNIEIFLCIGSTDIEDLYIVLERDWKASHMMFIGVQDYDLREQHPNIDPMMCLYFARLLAEVGKYFERGKNEFVKN